VLTGESFKQLDARITVAREEAERKAREYEEANAEALAKKRAEERAEAEAKKRAEEKTRLERYTAHLEKEYPVVDGRRTLSPWKRKEYRREGYSDDMIDAAMDDLYASGTVRAVNGKVSAYDFQGALLTFKRLLNKQRKADPDSFMPIH
jgi:hypothetical protein